jgi:hypothetical protein
MVMVETELERRVGKLETDSAVMHTLLETHVTSCDKRGERSEKVQLIILTAVIGALCTGIVQLFLKLAHH